MRRQSGVTLIELMIGLVLGLLVVGIATQMYISTLGITKQTTASARLNQEMRSIMGLIIGDIRRAGYFHNSVVASNPYASLVEGPPAKDPLAINIFDYSSVSDACVIIAYDNSSPPTDEHIYGYRIKKGTSQIEMLTVSSYASSSLANCAEIPSFVVSGGWEDLSDATVMNVTELKFNRFPSIAASWADASSKGIEVVLKATSVIDSGVKKELREQVRIRNEY